MSKPTPKQIIITWADSYDRRIPIRKEERLAAYIELLKTFQKYGYGKDDVTTSTFNDIIKESVPQEHKPVSKKVKWTEMAERDLSSAMEMVWVTVELAEVNEEDLALAAKKKIEFAMAQEKVVNDRFEKSQKLSLNVEKRPPVELDDTVLRELGIDNE